MQWIPLNLTERVMALRSTEENIQSVTLVIQPSLVIQISLNFYLKKCTLR